MSAWIVWGGTVLSHYRDIDNKRTYCGEAYDVLTERRWSVFQDVGRIALCEKCKKAIKRADALAWCRTHKIDVKTQAMKELFEMLAADTAEEIRQMERSK